MYHYMARECVVKSAIRHPVMGGRKLTGVSGL